MGKKIIGLSCGRKNGNGEALLKSALMGVESEGVETEIIRIHDLKVLPCTSCGACQKTGKCPKDDVDWILEKTLLGGPDVGVIVAAPVYHLRPNALFFAIAEKTNHLFPRDPDLFLRRRVGAAISVGGSGYEGWTAYGLQSINLFLQHFSQLVDQIQVNHCADMGGALTPDNQWAIDRCRKLGINMAKAIKLPPEEVKYVGEDSPLSCPVCHCNIMYFDKDYPHIMCATCEVHGELSVADGKYKVKWNEDDIKNPRFSKEKEDYHLKWIARHRTEEHPQAAMPETQAKIKEYAAWGKYIVPDKK